MSFLCPVIPRPTLLVVGALGGALRLPVEHAALVLIPGMLELLTLQCSMLLETFQNLKQLDLSGLFAGNLSEKKFTLCVHKHKPSEDMVVLSSFGTLKSLVAPFQKFAKIFEKKKSP